ncbi:MAG: hypothetical protein JW955_03430 [Sedimentisphaerales bacterium]|nr:hypothetical protein [Sedimentisphaerales bacterium]
MRSVRQSHIALAIVLMTVGMIAAILVGRSSATNGGGNILDQNDVTLVDTVGTNRICFHRNTACVDPLRPLIIERIKRAVSEVGKIVAVTNVEFRVVVFPEKTLPDKGISGVAPNKEDICILLDPTYPRLRKSLSEELVAVIAHEYHHTLRYRTVGSGATLFEAIMSEGLADLFCMEVTGHEPPWAKQIPKEELAPWRAKAEKEWFNSDYDSLAWFVGLNSDIPRGTGYSMGRNIVAEYLAAHSEDRPSTLYATPAREFLPGKQEESLN